MNEDNIIYKYVFQSFEINSEGENSYRRYLTEKEKLDSGLPVEESIKRKKKWQKCRRQSKFLSISRIFTLFARSGSLWFFFCFQISKYSWLIE